MFHLIGVVVVVILVLAFIGWLITPTVVILQQPVQEAPGDDFDPRPVLEAMARNFGSELRQMDQRAQQVLNQAAPDHRATIEEYRARLVRR